MLSEELHFGRTAERMFRSQPRVSRLIASLEAEVSGTLFERTNRRVQLTPLGAQLEARLRPAYVELLAARDDARRSTIEIQGTLRVAFPSSVQGPGLTRLVDAFSRHHPDCTISMSEVTVSDPYNSLRSGHADVLYNWLTLDEPDLAHSLPIERYGRLLAISRKDPLAREAAVTTEQLVGRAVPVITGIPEATYSAFYPPPVLADALACTRAQPDTAGYRVRSMVEVWALVARGKVIHAGAATLRFSVTRDDIALLPITDLPPLPIGLIWKPANENARVRAFVAIAKALAAPGHMP